MHVNTKPNLRTEFVKRITRVSYFSTWRNGGKENRDFCYTEVLMRR